ncbi:MAG: hypothetical protein B7Z80_03205 [Rhodospirillales bacterium 20-64-7]|nr:MAG: hypothetical protein B7Z80_03205 [Rhodospirillales bacterium 20-64-7]
MPLQTDTLTRRIRFAPPQPIDQRIDITDSDLALFEAIHRHGPLPSHYLFAFTGKSHFNSHQHRLTKLYNGTAHGAYLVRPSQQFASFHARYQPVVYDLNEKSKQLLIEHGKLSPYIKRLDPFLHRLMSACVGASIELSCTPRGLTYIPRHAILKRTDSPMELPLSQFVPQKSLVPDDVFGIDYGGSYRFFAVEIDRNTESIERRKIDQNTFGKKLTCYIDAMKILLTDEAFDAAEALRVGLINEVVPHDQLLARAEAIARQIVALPPVAVRMMKEFVVRFGNLPDDQAWHVQNLMNALLIQTTMDGEEGRQAFNEKRPPNFTGTLRRRGEPWPDLSEEEAKRLDEAYRSGEY